MKAAKLTVSVPFILLVLLVLSTGLAAATGLFSVTSESKLLASDGAAFDSLGSSIALNGDTLIAGALLQDQRGLDAGAAYIFRRGSAGWTQETKLTANDGATGDWFGTSVGLDGDTAIVGARLNDPMSLTNAGAAYIFRRTGTAWVQETKLTASDGAAFDQFGFSVSVDGNIAVVGALADDDGGSNAGSAYIFRWNGTAWIQEAKLAASDAAEGDLFGFSVSARGDTVVIGSPFDDAGATDSGSAYVFRWNGTVWVQEGKLTASDAAEGDQFGSSASVDGNTAVIGARFDDAVATDSGSAYVFRWNGTAWVQEAKLTASDGVATDWLGSSVSIKGDVVAVGALGDDNGMPNSGRVFLFQRTGTTWGGETKLAASDATAGDKFGWSVSLDGSTLAVSATGDDDKGEEAGAVYILQIAVANQPPTADAGGPYTVAEGGAVIVAASGSDPEGNPLTFAWDLNNDGTFETPGQSVTFSAAGRDGPSTATIQVQVTDAGGLTATDQAQVIVLNVAPTVDGIAAPVDPVAIGTPINASAGFADPGTPDTHTAVFDWGDNSISSGTVTETAGSGTASGTHSYSAAGVYTIALTVTDDDGASGQAVFRFVVVYDPMGGFVTGGGWINSPTGAYALDPSLTGRANFGFVSKYQNGATAPTGETQFNFRVASFNFHSTEYHWLVVSGPNAQFKGTGTINGNGSYEFKLTAIDGQLSGGGGVDKFRIKISDKATGVVIYDNKMGESDEGGATTPLGGGSITIHHN